LNTGQVAFAGTSQKPQTRGQPTTRRVLWQDQGPQAQGDYQKQGTKSQATRTFLCVRPTIRRPQAASAKIINSLQTNPEISANLIGLNVECPLAKEKLGGPRKDNKNTNTTNWCHLTANSLRKRHFQILNGNDTKLNVWN